jgi:hypothetical protein
MSKTITKVQVRFTWNDGKIEEIDENLLTADSDLGLELQSYALDFEGLRSDDQKLYDAEYADWLFIPKDYDTYMASGMVDPLWEAGFIAGKMHEITKQHKEEV